MRSLLFFVLIFALAAGFGVMIHNDPGYSLFAYKDWTIEMPLWLTLIFLILIVIAIIALLSLFNFIFGSRNRLRAWWARRQQKIARINTARGLLELTEGHWKRAERYLSQSAALSDAPLINYLSAAKAAEAEGATERRNEYLNLASKSSPTAQLAVKITEAKLQIKHGNLPEALSLLEGLHEEYPRQEEVLRLLTGVYEKQENWHSLLLLLSSLKKSNLLSKEETFKLEKKIYFSLLPSFKDDKKMLSDFWKSAPKGIQNDPDCIFRYASVLHQMSVDFNQKPIDHEAEKLLKNFLAKNWQNDIVDLYGKVNGESPKKQLSFAEDLLEREPLNPVLYLALGRLCLRNQLWGKARDYLEKSLSLAPNPEVCALLGALMERLGDKTKSEQYIKRGLSLALPKEG